MSARRSGLFLALSLALSACGKSREAAEAERVLHAVDALRDAPAGSAEGRIAQVEALEREPAEAAPARLARDACAKAYRALEEASALEAGARAKLADLGQAGKDATVLLGDVRRAEAKLAESKAAMPACEEAEAALARAAR